MILITGATGLVGSHTLFHFLYNEDINIRIRAIIRKDDDKLRIKKVFSHYTNDNIDKNLNRVDWFISDIKNYSAMSEALDGVDEVYHCAAKVSFAPKNANHIMDINLNCLTNLLNLSFDRGVKKFCYIGSVSALSYKKKNDDGLIDEDSFFDSIDYGSAYAISKYESEMEAIRAYKEGLNVAIVLPSVILGPTKGILKTIDHVSRKNYFYTNGGFGFVSVKDVVKVMVELMKSNNFGNRYIVSSQNLSYKQLILEILSKLDKKRKLYNLPDCLVKVIYKLDNFFTKITFNLKKNLIPKSIAISSMQRNYFSNKKIIDELNYEFEPIDETIKELCKIYRTSLIKKKEAN